jgi:hypothetical protein
MNEDQGFISKIVLARLILSGALVAVAIANILGLSNGTSSQVIAGMVGALSIAGLKIAHFI